jgi:hypothetical protein
MALDKEDKNFKALINKEFTSPSRKFYQEIGTDTINMHAREVWTQTVDSDPSQAVTDGLAKLYTSFSLTADATYPTDCYTFVSGGVTQRNFISDKYGSDYEVELYDDDDTRIYKTDDIDWIFDYQTGILNIGDSSQVTAQGYNTPFKVTAYQYIGVVLSQSVGDSGIISAEWDGSRDGSASITGSFYVTQTISGSTITGSNVEAANITGSIVSASNFYGDGSGITGVTAEWDGSHVGNANITGSLYVTQTISGSTITGSSIEAATITGSVVSASNFYGDGSNITGVTAEWDGSHVGNASITGSLYVTQIVSGSSVEATSVTGSVLGNVTGDVTGDLAGSVLGDVTGDVTGDLTGSVLGDVTGDVTGTLVQATNITGSIVSASNFYGDGSGITGVTAEWDGSHVGNASITGSLYVTQIVSGSSVEATSVTGSVLGDVIGDITGDLTGTLVQATNITGSIISASNFYGDGSGITGVTAEWDGTHTGDASITGSLTIKSGHLNLTSSGGTNYLRGFLGFPRVQEVSSSLGAIDAIAQELHDNSGSYNGYAVYIISGSTPALSGTFAQNNKFYFNENGVWHPSPFYFQT